MNPTTPPASALPCPNFRFHDIVSLNHHKNLNGRPSQNCAADSRHFSESKALAYTFLVLDPASVKEKDDGRLESCRLQCAVCNAKGSQKGWFEWNELSDRGTGHFHKHFKSTTITGHSEWWNKVDAEDKMLRGIEENVEEGGTLMSLVSCTSYNLLMLDWQYNCHRVGRLRGLQVSTSNLSHRVAEVLYHSCFLVDYC